MATQIIAENLAQAVEQAIRLSKELGYAAIVLSKGQYYVETDTPLVRTWEELIGQYENGDLLK